MMKVIALVLVSVCCASAEPGIVPGVVTAQSSQVFARNYNTIVPFAPAPHHFAPAPFAPAPAFIPAPSRFVSPFHPQQFVAPYSPYSPYSPHAYQPFSPYTRPFFY